MPTLGQIGESDPYADGPFEGDEILYIWVPERTVNEVTQDPDDRGITTQELWQRLKEFSGYPAIMQLTSENTGVNVNTTSPTTVPWTTEWRGHSLYNYTLPATEVEVTEAGLYRLYCNLSVQAFFQSRLNPQLSFAVNGTPLPPKSQSTYIRVSSSHEEASTNLETVTDLQAGDLVSVRSKQMAASGNVFLRANESEFRIERVPFG